METCTSSFFLLYIHCVLPLYHIVALPVRAQNLLPFMAMVPLCFPIFEPVMLKFAVAPDFILTLAAALSRARRASAALPANVVSAVNMNIINDNNFFMKKMFCIKNMSVSDNYTVPKVFSKDCNVFSSCMSTSRGFEPRGGPTILAFSNWSISFPARL